MKLALIAVSTLMFATAATAQEARSVYSDWAIKKCQQESIDNDGGSWFCKGIKGWDIFYWEGDLRGNMAFGPAPHAQCSSAQSFAPFNSPGNRIEWRMKGGKPYATILRWTTDSGEPGGKRTWLAVTKLAGRMSCWTTIIEGSYSNANAVARQKADTSANFNCKTTQPEILATTPQISDHLISGAPCGDGPFKED